MPEHARVTERSDPDLDNWWRQNKYRVDTPLRKLVDGLDDIAETAIPYHWIPGRAETLYADHFTTWADIGGETMSTLLAWPKAGIGTVRTVALAAREAVALARTTPNKDRADVATVITRMLDQLDDYDRHLLSARRWTLHPQTIPQTADSLGVARINVERHTPRAFKRFQHLLAQPAYAVLNDDALQLRERLGPLTTVSTAEQAVKALDLDLITESGQLLLHLAGPYTPKGQWLERLDTNALTQASELVNNAFERDRHADN